MSEARGFVERAQELEAKATPGPWRTNDRDDIYNYQGVLVAGMWDYNMGGICNTEDATFIAATRELVPDLATALLAVEQENERLREMANRDRALAGQTQALSAKVLEENKRLRLVAEKALAWQQAEYDHGFGAKEPDADAIEVARGDFWDAVSAYPALDPQPDPPEETG